MRKMKDSGIEWIGQIPDSWEITKIKNYCSEIYSGGTPSTGNSEYWDGNIPWIPSGCCHNCIVDCAPKMITQLGLESSSTKMIPANTALVAMTGGSCGNTGFLTIEACANQSVTAYISKKDISSSKYIYYLLQASKKELLTFQTGGAQGGVNVENCKNIDVPFLSIQEQLRIANFLDEKINEIDSIISKTIKTIEEYRAYRNSIISEKIIFGMDSSVPVKNTGVAWCPQIPEHWNVINPKALFSLRKDKAREGDRQLTASQKKGIMYQDEYMESEGVRVVVVQKDFDILKHVEPDDFVISMRSFQGGLEYSELRGCISSAYVMLIPNKEKVYSPFYKWFFKSSKYINAIQSTSNLVRDGQAMRYSNFAQVPLLDIPMEEQQKIAEYLSEKCAEIDALIAKKEAFVEEMEAYKKSLIYEYVTGKKEVL